MGRESMARLGLWVVLAMGLGALAFAAEAPLPAPIPSRQTLFGIPFRIDTSNPRLPPPRAVQLYCSKDLGVTWDLYGTVEPSAGSFLFRAPADGEYWFSIHTVSAAGQVQSQKPGRPGLRVLVDTVPPRVQLEAWRGGAGEVVARWQITDPNLSPESLKIEYRTGSDERWQAVAIDRTSLRVMGMLCAGEVRWRPGARADRVDVRADVADKAGNTAVSQAQVGGDRSAGHPPKPIAGDTLVPGANPGAAGGPLATDPAGDPAGDPPPFYPSERAKADLVGPELGAPSGKPTPQPRPAPETLFRMPDGTVAIQMQPGIGSQHSPSGPSVPGSRDGLPPGGLPPGQRVRVVNALQFELEYDVESVGPSGIARVELWGTRDGGRTWTSFGRDDDKLSPFLVRVREEGIYGFCIAVQSGVGLGDEPPQPGSPAQVWIGVDLTKPLARILSAEQVPGSGPGQLVIRWQVEDWMLAARPIGLYFSPSREGPWSPIATGLENTGQYAWALDRRTAEQLFLRLEARDEAGNVGIFETPLPISIDQRRPQGRIREVRRTSG